MNQKIQALAESVVETIRDAKRDDILGLAVLRLNKDHERRYIADEILACVQRCKTTSKDSLDQSTPPDAP